MIAGSAALLIFATAQRSQLPEQENPAELKSALIFGALYALVIFATGAAEDYVGSKALYAIGFVSGFVDMDAITLSTAQLAGAKRIDTTTAWQVILIASLANLAFKAGAAWVLGSGALFVRVALAFGAASTGGLLILLAWPASLS